MRKGWARSPTPTEHKILKTHVASFHAAAEVGAMSPISNIS